MNNEIKFSPFLKWAGGKRWLAPKLVPLLRKELDLRKGKYFEPFLGAGAIFFALSPTDSVLSDINENLIDVYLEVQRNWLAIIDEIKNWPVSKDFYYHMRKSQPSSRFERSCRFLYLNRTCYGGLHRENKLGQFNVPYGGGRSHNHLWEHQLLQHASSSLNNNVIIRCSDFEEVINSSNEGDIVYCDPTYSTIKRTQFDRYGKTVFNWSDQIRLAASAEKAMNRGVLVLVSNSGFLMLNDFYPKAYRINLEKTKSIGNKAKSSTTHQESLFILDPHSRKNYWRDIGEILNRKSNSSFTSKGNDDDITDLILNTK